MNIIPKSVPIVKKEEPSTIINKVVTPNNQLNMRDNEYKLDIFNRHNKQNVEIVEKLTKMNAIPELVETTNGEMFIDPSQRIVSSLEDTYIKWLVFGSDQMPVRGHSYPMVQLPQMGYIMKLVIPNNGFKPEDVVAIEYLYNYRDISVEIINESNVTSFNEINSEIRYMIKQYEAHKYQKIFKLLADKKEFYNKYLRDLFE